MHTLSYLNCYQLVWLILLLANFGEKVTSCKKGSEVAINAKDYQKVGLKMHNKARRHHNTEEMVLDEDLDRYADKCAEHYAKKGTIDHSCTTKFGAGENLYMGPSYRSADSDKSHEASAVEKAVKMWYDEIQHYDFSKHGQKGGVVGHFTQVVWKDSTKLGIGIANGESQYGKVFFVVGLYREHGNSGRNRENVLPPKSGQPFANDGARTGHFIGTGYNLWKHVVCAFGVLYAFAVLGN